MSVEAGWRLTRPLALDEVLAQFPAVFLCSLNGQYQCERFPFSFHYLDSLSPLSE
jgi:hypothetical protein